MLNNRNIIIFLFFILATLFLRDVPYFNVLFINKLWILYFFMFVFFLIYVFRAKLKYLLYSCLVLIIPTLFFLLIKLGYFAETVGVVVYFFLWVVVIDKIRSLVKD